MNKQKYFVKLAVVLLAMLLGALWAGASQAEGPPLTPASADPAPLETQIAVPQLPDLPEQLSSQYQAFIPLQWGDKVTGVAYRLDTQEKVLALTLDACGGSDQANGYDAALIDYLKARQIPATLFVTGQWIQANQTEFLQLSRNNIFVIGNHGLNHLPCSINGKSAYGIRGTGNVPEVIEEVNANGFKIYTLTGHTPLYYRSGTNYYDEVGVAIALNLGYITIGCNVAGDAGATFNREQVKKTLLGARAGSIVLLHFNHPEGQTAEGMMEAIPILQQNGFKFVPLSAFPLVTYP